MADGFDSEDMLNTSYSHAIDPSVDDPTHYVYDWGIGVWADADRYVCWYISITGGYWFGGNPTPDSVSTFMSTGLACYAQSVPLDDSFLGCGPAKKIGMFPIGPITDGQGPPTHSTSARRGNVHMLAGSTMKGKLATPANAVALEAVMDSDSGFKSYVRPPFGTRTYPKTNAFEFPDYPNTIMNISSAARPDHGGGLSSPIAVAKDFTPRKGQILRYIVYQERRIDL